MTGRTARRSESGSVMVEFALATVIFFMLVIAVIDLGRLHFFRSRLQYAVSQSTRFAAIGGHLTDKKGKQMSRSNSIVQKIKDLSTIDINATDVSIQSVTKGGKTVSGPGGPGDVVTVLATYRVPILAPYLSSAFKDGQYKFTVGTTFRNEEFGGGPGSDGTWGDDDDK